MGASSSLAVREARDNLFHVLEISSKLESHAHTDPLTKSDSPLSCSCHVGAHMIIPRGIEDRGVHLQANDSNQRPAQTLLPEPNQISISTIDHHNVQATTNPLPLHNLRQHSREHRLLHNSRPHPRSTLWRTCAELRTKNRSRLRLPVLCTCG